MKKTVISFFILFSFITTIYSQDYYYYKSEKKPLELNIKYLYVFSNSKEDIKNIQSPKFKISSEIKTDQTTFNLNTSSSFLKEKKYWKEIELQGISNNDYVKLISTLRNTFPNMVIAPYFKNKNDDKIGLSNYFYVKLKRTEDYNLLVNYAESSQAVILGKNKFMPLWYTLSATNKSLNALYLANKFYETGLFQYSEPDLILNLLHTNDPYYSDQWGLKNTGQYNGNSGIDINIEEAWNITEGNSEIKIAVLDHGFEMDHPDLIDNVFGNGFDTENGTSPSIVRGAHGTACAGIISAKRNNNEGISGVAPNSKIISISNYLTVSTNTRQELADGINWAWQNGADIISNSWGHNDLSSSLIDDAFNNAFNQGRNGLGTIVVTSVGNNNGNITYPASSNSSILTVGAMNQCGERKSPSSCDGESWGSNYGSKLDVVAPGVKVATTDIQGNPTSYNYYPPGDYNPLTGGPSGNYSNYDYHRYFNGTSAACPHVSGLAALILSVNPLLNVEQVSDIIEQTAQKVGGYSYQVDTNRPNGTWNEEMGYGLIDAHAALQLTQTFHLDLYTKDSPDDDGTEPNSVTTHMWTSEDIWIRNNDDNGLAHQNPEYRSNNEPNYINVKIINRGSVASTGNETLTINWAKANTALSWPQNWDGSIQNSLGFDLGGELDSVIIPIVQPGDEVIVKIPWVVPNPNNYSDNDNPWHFCLLSKIESIDDPLTSPMTSNPNIMVRNNNNLAWKNLTIVDLIADRTYASVMVGNPSDAIETYSLEFLVEDDDTGKAIFEEAEVSIKIDETIFNAWERGGKRQTSLKNNRLDEKNKLISGNKAVLEGIKFAPNERGS